MGTASSLLNTDKLEKVHTPLVHILTPALISALASIIVMCASLYTSHRMLNNAIELNVTSEKNQRLGNVLKDRNRLITELFSAATETLQKLAHVNDYNTASTTILLSSLNITNKSRELTIIGNDKQRAFAANIILICSALTNDIAIIDAASNDSNEIMKRGVLAVIKAFNEIGLLCGELTKAATIDYDYYLKGSIGAPADIGNQ